MSRASAIALVFAVLIAAPAIASADPDPALGFAPANTDIVLCSDLTALEAFLGANASAADTGARKRLDQLRDLIPVEALRKLHMRSLCTFHVRDTDHQLAVFELDRPLPAWLSKKLEKQTAQAQKDGRTYLAFSRTPELVKNSPWRASSRLSPELAKASESLATNNFWSVVEVDTPLRGRLINNTGTIGASVPEIDHLQQLRFVVELVASNDLTLTVSAAYASAEIATRYGPDVARWLPFLKQAGKPTLGDKVATFTIQHISYQDLNKFLSQF